jgi:CDP-4-dehydro-6-deoxyglucose reductase, E3
MDVNAGETVLAAALRQNIDFPYSCQSAVCSTCRGRIISGKITYGEEEIYGIDEEEQAQGHALFCSAIPESDLVIEVHDVDNKPL